MAGYVGAGGLGKIAIVDGYQRFNDESPGLLWRLLSSWFQLVQFLR